MDKNVMATGAFRSRRIALAVFNSKLRSAQRLRKSGVAADSGVSL
jgi:hypothetical protein